MGGDGEDGEDGVISPPRIILNNVKSCLVG